MGIFLSQGASEVDKLTASMGRLSGAQIAAGLAGQSAKDLEITFERFLASLYMTGMLKLGLMREQGAAPQLDLIGARQTIDSLSLLSDKTNKAGDQKAYANDNAHGIITSELEKSLGNSKQANPSRNNA